MIRPSRFTKSSKLGKLGIALLMLAPIAGFGEAPNQQPVGRSVYRSSRR